MNFSALLQNICHLYLPCDRVLGYFGDYGLYPIDIFVLEHGLSHSAAESYHEEVLVHASEALWGSRFTFGS
jgi:hypothetical protein